MHASLRYRGIRRACQACGLWLLALGTIGCERAADDPDPPVPSEIAPAPSGSPIDSSTAARPAAAPAALRKAMEALLRGEAEPMAAGSWFSSRTAGALRSVSIDSVGHAVVDFEDLRPLIPNASSSAGSEMLLQELNAAVFGVAAVRSVDYTIEGRCDRFWEWLQRGCQTVHRPALP